jgi:hypothetical protein
VLILPLLSPLDQLARRIDLIIVQASFDALRNAGSTKIKNDVKNDELISKKRRKATKNKTNNI